MGLSHGLRRLGHYWVRGIRGDPALVLLLKLSLVIAVQIGIFLLLVVFTTLFGRILNILRKL